MIINIWPIPLLDKDLLDIKPFLRKFRYRGFCSLYPIAAVRLDRPGIYPHPLASLQELSRSCARAPSAEPGPLAVFGLTAISLARARSRLSPPNPPYFMPMTVPPSPRHAPALPHARHRARAPAGGRGPNGKRHECQAFMAQNRNLNRCNRGKSDASLTQRCIFYLIIDSILC